MCGQTIPITDNDFAVARYNTDGSLDNSFGVAGKVTFDLGTDSDEGRSSVTIQPDGKIVTAGSTAYNSFDNYDIVVARLISGLDIGIIDLSLANSAPLNDPNPIDKRATLEYTLRNAETISIQLLDMQGKTVRSFIQGQHQAAGEHQLNIDLLARSAAIGNLPHCYFLAQRPADGASGEVKGDGRACKGLSVPARVRLNVIALTDATSNHDRVSRRGPCRS